MKKRKLRLRQSRMTRAAVRFKRIRMLTEDGIKVMKDTGVLDPFDDVSPPEGKGTIVLGGQMLMERPHQDHWQARVKSAQDGLNMFKNHPAQSGGPLDGRSAMRAFKATIGPGDSVDMSPEAFQEAKGTLKLIPATFMADEVAYAEVPLRIAVSDAQIRVAMYLGLSPGEYIRRLVIMDTDWLMRVSTSSIDDSVQPVFARGVMRMQNPEIPYADGHR